MPTDALLWDDSERSARRFRAFDPAKDPFSLVDTSTGLARRHIGRVANDVVA